MVAITDTANRLFPVLLTGAAAELEPEAITRGAGSRETRRYTDLDGTGSLDTAGFVFTNTNDAAQYDYLELFTEFLDSQTGTEFTFNDSEISLLELVSTAQSDRRGFGSQTFNRCSIFRVGGNTTATNNRLLLGPTGADSTWVTNNTTVVGFANNPVALLYQNAPAASTTNNGLTLIGNVATEFGSAHTSLQTVWNNGGGTGQVQDFATEPAVYTYRITQFGAVTNVEADANNVNNVNTNTGTREVALFVGDDLRNIALAGSDPNFIPDVDVSGTPVSPQTFLMINRRAVHWIVGGRWDGTLPVGHHSSNQPTSMELAEIRNIIPFNPSFQDANNTILQATARVNFYQGTSTVEALNVEAPATWDFSTPPIFSDQDRLLTSASGTQWILDSRTIYGAANAATTVNNNPARSTANNANPNDVTPVPAITNKTMRARAYGVIIPETTTVDFLEQHGLVTGLTESTATRIEYAVDPNVGTVTETEAANIVNNVNDLTSIDQLYAAIQYDWARNQDMTANIVVTVNGMELDFGARDVTFNGDPSFNFGITGSQVNIPTTGTIDATALFNTIRTTGQVIFSGGAVQGDNLIVIDANSPGALDVVFEIPAAWRSLAGAYYAFTTTTNVIESGLTTDLTGATLFTSTGSAGTEIRLALVHPAYVDVIAVGMSNATQVVNVQAGPPVLNPLFSTDANTVYDGGDTAASYFGVYDGSPAVTPSVQTDPNDGSFMSVESLQNAATNAKRLNGTRMNNIAHNFKGNAFGARYAQVAAISNTSPVTSTATTGVTISNLINFAYSQPASIENGAVVIEGIEGSLQVQQGTRTGFDSPIIDYDIVEGRVIAGSGTSLDNRLLDRQNNIDSALLLPRTET